MVDELSGCVSSIPSVMVRMGGIGIDDTSSYLNKFLKDYTPLSYNLVIVIHKLHFSKEEEIEENTELRHIDRPNDKSLDRLKHTHLQSAYYLRLLSYCSFGEIR